jgi:hypothetical protein
VSVDNARLAVKPEIASRISAGHHPGTSIRHAVYAAMPLLLATISCPGAQPERRVPEITSWLSDILRVDRESSWDEVRSAVVAVWLAMNH